MDWRGRVSHEPNVQTKYNKERNRNGSMDYYLGSGRHFHMDTNNVHHGCVLAHVLNDREICAS